MQIDIEEYIENATKEVIEVCEQAVASVAGDYFQKRFVEKEFSKLFGNNPLKSP